jgi:tetratricopeptide (TPR) repeat protein
MDQTNRKILENPSQREVERALERIIGNAAFAKAPKQAAILRFAVEQTLNLRDISEKEIAFAVFGAYDPNSPKIRVNVRHLRDRMREYYNGPGRDDLVIITLPPGPAYRPIFSHHHDSSCLIHYRHGMAHLSDPLRSFLEMHEAIREFSASIEAQPTFAPAYARKSESELLEYILSDAFDLKRPHILGDLPDFGFSIQKALELDPQLALAHIVNGAVRVAYGDREGANEAFARALTLDPVETRQNWWYAAYLLTIGRRDESLEIARDLAKENLENQNAELLYALFLYIVGQHHDAGSIVSQTFGSTEFYRPAEERPLRTLLWGLICLAQNHLHDALKWLERASRVTDAELHIIRGFISYQDRPIRYGGLLLACLTRLAKDEVPREYPPNWPEEAKNIPFERQKAELVTDLERSHYVTPFNLALVFMALGKENKAIAALRLAGRRNVLTTWLHLWPFLDPLRGHKLFRGLVERYACFPHEY